jgi:hypothetical protein
MSGEGFPIKIGVLLLVTMLGLAAGVLTYQARDHNQRTEVASLLARGDPARAPDIFRRYGCTGCHTIPGIPGGDGQVGGPLINMRERVYIAGVANKMRRHSSTGLCRQVRSILKQRCLTPAFPRRRPGIWLPTFTSSDYGLGVARAGRVLM